MTAANIEYHDAAGNPTTPEKATQVWFRCPRRAGPCGPLLLAGRNPGIKRDPQNKNGGRAQWDISGAVGRETLTPSVNCGRCWHGYIRNGRCVTTGNIDEPEPKR